AFTVRYRSHARSPEVLYALARIAQSNGQNERAIAAYRRLIDAYPKAAQSREARWRIGWIYYQAGEWGAAARAFDAAAPGGGAAARDAGYWEARAPGGGGDGAGAARLYRAVWEGARATYSAWWAARGRARAERAAAARAAPPQPRLRDTPAGTDPYHWSRAR